MTTEVIVKENNYSEKEGNDYKEVNSIESEC